MVYYNENLIYTAKVCTDKYDYYYVHNYDFPYDLQVATYLLKSTSTTCMIYKSKNVHQISFWAVLRTYYILMLSMTLKASVQS